MKNHNEEIQILSEDSTNNNNIQDNNSINVNENLNIDQTRQNDNVAPQQKGSEIQNMIDDIDDRLKNFEPEKHYKNFGRPLGHHNYRHHPMNGQRNFTNPNYIIFVIIFFIRQLNLQILQIFTGFSMTIDMFINRSNYSPIIKRIIHSKQIFIIIYIINIQYLLGSVESISFLNELNKFSLKLMILSMIAMHAHYYFYNQKLFIEKDEELEKFYLKRNPQVMKAMCMDCNTLKIMRSGHCLYCNKCVKKFQLHSDWLNICIGSNNELLYAITIFFINLYFFISNIIFWYYILVKSDLLKYLFFLFFIFAIIGIYILINSLKFCYTFIFEHLLANLTVNERGLLKRLIYLWSDGRKNDFFNPFNKGAKRNIEEMLVNLFDIDIYSNYKNFACQNLSEIIDDDKINNKEEEFNENDEIESFKAMIKLTEHFDPLITSKGNIYKFVDGKEIINWNRLCIFTVFDLINSPYKENIIALAKTRIHQREVYLENMKHQYDHDNENENENDKKREGDEIVVTKEIPENMEEDKLDDGESIDKENNNNEINENNNDNIERLDNK